MQTPESINYLERLLNPFETSFIDGVKQDMLRDLEHMKQETEAEIAKLTEMMRPPTWMNSPRVHHCCNCACFDDQPESISETVVRGFVRG